MNENYIFEEAPVRKAYFTMALPVVFSMVVTLVYNMVDTYFIARTGNTDLVAGVSLCAPIFTLLIALGDILGLGGSSLISRLFGKGMDTDGKRISGFCFYGAIIGGLIVTIVLLLLKHPILALLGADVDTIAYANSYYTYLVIGAPFIILSFTPSNQLRTEGLAKESMIGTMMGSIINIILDPIFIFMLGLGAGGAAIATVLGNVCGDIFFTWILINRSKKLTAVPKNIKISGKELGQILAIGIPASITNLMQSIGIALTNRFLLPFGNDKIASMGIVMKVNMIAILVLVGFAFGAQPLIGYNYGSGNKKRLKDILKFCFKFECGLALVLSICLSLLAKPVLMLFMKNTAIVNAGVPMLRLQLISAIFVAIVLVVTVVFQSAGKAMGAFILSASRQGVIFAIVIVCASAFFGYYGVLGAQAISDFLTAIVAILLYMKLIHKELQ